MNNGGSNTPPRRDGSADLWVRSTASRLVGSESGDSKKTKQGIVSAYKTVRSRCRQQNRPRIKLSGANLNFLLICGHDVVQHGPWDVQVWSPSGPKCDTKMVSRLVPLYWLRRCHQQKGGATPIQTVKTQGLLQVDVMNVALVVAKS